MLAVLKEHGYQIVSDPSRAEVIIVNTCGFIQSQEEAHHASFEMAGYKASGLLPPAGRRTAALRSATRRPSARRCPRWTRLWA